MKVFIVCLEMEGFDGSYGADPYGYQHTWDLCFVFQNITDAEKWIEKNAEPASGGCCEEHKNPNPKFEWQNTEFERCYIDHYVYNKHGDYVDTIYSISMRCLR